MLPHSNIDDTPIYPGSKPAGIDYFLNDNKLKEFLK